MYAFQRAAGFLPASSRAANEAPGAPRLSILRLTAVQALHAKVVDCLFSVRDAWSCTLDTLPDKPLHCAMGKVLLNHVHSTTKYRLKSSLLGVTRCSATLPPPFCCFWLTPLPLGSGAPSRSVASAVVLVALHNSSAAEVVLLGACLAPWTCLAVQNGQV